LEAGQKIFFSHKNVLKKVVLLRPKILQTFLSTKKQKKYAESL